MCTRSERGVCVKNINAVESTVAELSSSSSRYTEARGNFRLKVLINASGGGAHTRAHIHTRTSTRTNTHACRIRRKRRVARKLAVAT